jgi:hypothetical protein
MKRKTLGLIWLISIRSWRRISRRNTPLQNILPGGGKGFWEE